mmetsp:Transcript_37528/g.72711  ORF Transcript_37528/g.72711 Transcript_37528/m.72711 type:complete len:668 (+) Transcript_37528:110-2113(+)
MWERYRVLLSILGKIGLRKDEIKEMVADYDDDCASMTGVYYDDRCLKHADEDDESVERPKRASEIFAALRDEGILKQCRRVPGRMATKEEICSVHTAPFYRMIKATKHMYDTNAKNVSVHLDEEKDTYVNEFSFDAASLSAGGLIELASRVVEGRLKNGFAILRPPGHHAEKCKAMGFCLFNHIAITAKMMQKRYSQVEKILIVDWDVHHGNGTQKSFETDPSVLYFSVHRYEGGSFFPGSGKYSSVGRKAGVGKTVNVPLPCPGYGDTEYMQVFSQILLPIAREYEPDLVLVSAGFDSAEGDIGDMKVTEYGFAQMTSMLVNTDIVKDGKIVVALEGGYNLRALVPSALETVKVLLGEPAPCIPCQEHVYNFFTWTERKRHDGALKRFAEVLARVMHEQSRFWNCFKDLIPRTTRTHQNELPTIGPANEEYEHFKKYVKNSTCKSYAAYLGRKIKKVVKGLALYGNVVQRLFQQGQTKWMIKYYDGTTKMISHVNMLKSLVGEDLESESSAFEDMDDIHDTDIHDRQHNNTNHIKAKAKNNHKRQRKAKAKSYHPVKKAMLSPESVIHVPLPRYPKMDMDQLYDITSFHWQSNEKSWLQPLPKNTKHGFDHLQGIYVQDGGRYPVGAKRKHYSHQADAGPGTAAPDTWLSAASFAEDDKRKNFRAF